MKSVLRSVFSILFACVIIGAGTAWAADRTWTGLGSDTRWATPQNWSDNAVPIGNADVAIFPAGTPTAVLLDQSISIKTINFRNSGMTLTIAAGVNLHLDNLGALTLRAEENAVINGDGTLTFSVATGENFADNQAVTGKTLTILARITGANGFEHNGGGGTIVLANTANSQTGNTLLTAAGVLSVPAVANTGVACPLGTGSAVKFTTLSTIFRYTGGNGSTDRAFQHNAGAGQDVTIEHAGTGTLTFAGPLSSGNNNSHSFIFNVVDPSATIGNAAAIANGGTAALGIIKRGAGMQLLSAASTYTGNTVVEQGTLGLTSSGAISASSLIRMLGGKLLLNAGTPAATYTATFGTLQVDGYQVRLEVAPGATSATVNLAALTRLSGTVDFQADDLGATTKIFIDGQSDGLIGPWATVNNGAELAAYSSVLGIHAAVLPAQSLSALGPSVITNNAGDAARITSAGTAGGITLADNPTALALLSQEINTNALVTLGDYSLILPSVQIVSGASSLTLGNAPGDGSLSAPASAAYQLFLANANPAGDATLLVNADIENNGANPVRLDKAGPGDVILAGALTHTGATAVNEGTLIIDTPAATVRNLPSGVISGKGGLTLTGAATVAFPNVANTYAGTTTVAQGTARILNNATFGTAAAPVIVQNGAAIDFWGTAANGLRLGNEQVIAVGEGPDGFGALRNTGTLSQYWALSYLTLTGPLTVGANQRLDIRGDNAASTTLNFNGYGITKKGSAMFGLTQTTAINDQGTAFIDITAGSVTLEAAATLSGGTNNYIRVRGGAYFDLHNLSNPLNWALNLDANARVFTRAGLATNLNVVTGPVTLGGHTTFDAGGAFSDTYTGVISGTGPLVKAGNDAGITYLRNTANTWTGGTVISNGTLYTAAPGSLPGYATDVSVVSSGSLAFLVTDDPLLRPGWRLAEIDAVLNNGTTFQTYTTSAGFDTLYEDLDYADPLPHIGIRKFGPNTLTLSGEGANLGGIRVAGGTLDLSPRNRYLGDQSIFVGESTVVADPLATLIVSNSVQITTLDRGYNIAGQPQVIVGNSGRGVLRIADEAKIAGRIVVGNAATAVGAVYQSGGTVHNTGGAANDGRIGGSGYGYYLLAGGSCTNNGYTQIGQATSGVGILEQTGGTFAYGSLYGGSFGISRGGSGVVHLSGGQFRSSVTLLVGDSSENNSSGGYASFTVTDDAEATINGPVDLGNRNNMTAMLNLKGGTLNANRMWRASRTGTDALVNWNGGLFRANSAAQSELFNGAVAGLYPEVTLYEGGAAVDLPSAAMTLAVNTPLRAPALLGIVSIPVATPGAGYLGSPLVRITGGGGKGAAAFAHVDHASGTLTSIEIVAPGTGYTIAPTVTLVGGGAATAATLGTPVVGLSTSGGLAKHGAGTLRLNAASTYTGLTEVHEGTLRLGSAAAISPFSSLSVQGGRLDLGGFTITNENVTVSGGSIDNGALACVVLDKQGAETFELSSPLTLSSALPQRPLIPGLWEGMVRAAWDTTTPNPCTSIQLTTRAAIGAQASNATYAGGLWAGNNHTWIYSGFIWNRASTNETWSFRGRFDDNIRLVIDGAILINTGNAAAIVANVTLTPGPHAIELRFGDGAGSVGPTGEPYGIAYDPLGRASTLSSDYRQLLDPGDGSLLTIDIPELRGSGLVESFILQAWNTTGEGTALSRQLTTRAGNGTKTSNTTFAGGLWRGNTHTWIYKGILWNRGDSDLTWRWRFTFDDNVLLKIDDTVVRDVALAQGIVYQDHVLTPGPHTIEIRYGDGTGDVGPASGLGGLTYDPQASGSTDPADYILLQDPGDGSLLTTDIESGMPPERVLVNVNAGTLRVPSALPGIWEGRIDVRWDTTSPNPSTSVELTTTAANGFCGSGGTINGKLWPDNSTYVYSGYIWNRESTNVTWTFAENFDDQVLLRIGGTTVLDNNTWNTPTKGTITLAPGAHSFDLRLGQGSGGAGGNVAGWWSDANKSFAIDFQGRDAETFAFYQNLVDPGDGSLLTRSLSDPSGTGPFAESEVRIAAGATLDLDGSGALIPLLSGGGTVSGGTLAAGTVISPAGDAAIGTLALNNVTLAEGVIYRLTVSGEQSDALTSSGTLDLTGLTVVPANDTEYTAATYVIAQAAGGFSGEKPAVSGFPSKYKVIRKSTELVLTSQSGMVILLR